MQEFFVFLIAVLIAEIEYSLISLPIFFYFKKKGKMIYKEILLGNIILLLLFILLGRILIMFLGPAFIVIGVFVIPIFLFLISKEKGEKEEVEKQEKTDNSKKLLEIKKLLDEGLISQEDYEKKKEEILKNI